ncbi:hypothetical protein AB0910_28560 [Streptomyces sp. NPDC047002]|uniref:coiled-coil domain-containing protein n=1 Tax=Streptomyces sp. NPDC047002 TaxID=3155475 RepID=UPI0034553568
MPHGRHRHSPPLHKLLPPAAVAVLAVACAGGVWAVADPLVLRGVTALAGAAAVTAACMMRSWDREAGRRVAGLTRARESDQWKTDERVAELESDVDEAREIRSRLENKLRSKRVELARLRGEHAALLRRYATAETERASALEGRRRLAIGASAEPRALAAGGAPSPSAYLMASKALDELAANGARQAALPAPRARRAVEAAPRPADDGARQEAPRGASEGPAGPGEQPAAAAATREPAQDMQPQDAQPQDAAGGPRPALPARRAATPSAIVPYARRTGHRPEQRPGGSGFDFFGTQHGGRTAEADRDGGRDHPGSAEAGSRDGGRAARGADAAEGADGADGGPADPADGSEVIDLTEHDDTEQLEMGGLRSALGS